MSTTDRERRGGTAIRRRALGAVVCLAAVALMGTLPATASGAVGIGGPDAFGVTPNPLPDGRSQAYFTLSLSPGQTGTEAAVITNRGATSITLKLSPSTGTTAPNSGSAFIDAFGQCVGTGCWVTGLPSTLSLAPSSAMTVPFSVTVPAGTGVGQHLAGITAQPNAPPAPVTVGSNGRASAQAVVIEQVSVGVVVDVGAVSQMVTRLAIPTVTSTAVGTMPRLIVHAHNTGQTFVKAKGSATCTVGGSRRSYPVASDTVLPTEGAALVVNVPGLPFGTVVSCNVLLDYGNGQTATWSGKVTMPATTTPTTIVHTGPGAYSSLPVTGIPVWAIVLIVIGSLTLATLMVILFVLIRRRHQPGTGTGTDGGDPTPIGERPGPDITPVDLSAAKKPVPTSRR